VTFELGIEGGTVVTPQGRSALNVYVDGGTIAVVTADRLEASERVDATGLLVLPGGVDTHVHLMDPASTEREDFPTGTSAAARAGVTTVVEHTHAGPVRTPADLEEKRRYLHDRSVVDYALAAHAWPDQIAEVGALWRAGVAFIKVFTCTTHGVPGFDPGGLLHLFRSSRAVGAICLVHCEDETITADAERELRSLGRDDPSVIVEWRSREAELTALAVVAQLSRLTGARIVTAHVSNAEALSVVDRERNDGAPITIESCPQYLALFEDEIVKEGAFRKFTPPARARGPEDLAAMWAAVSDGRIDHISTDHAPSTAEQKRNGSIWDVHFGLPGLDTTFPFLLDAAASGAISYERLVDVYAESPARTYGLYPRKGRVGVGADADVVLVDPTAAWTVRNEDIISRAGWSPFEGRTFSGRAVDTYLRGRRIVHEGTVVEGPGCGRFLPGPGTEHTDTGGRR
jgi:dihydroorotase (multifunctional complex type)